MQAAKGLSDKDGSSTGSSARPDGSCSEEGGDCLSPQNVALPTEDMHCICLDPAIDIAGCTFCGSCCSNPQEPIQECMTIPEILLQYKTLFIGHGSMPTFA